VQINDVYTTLSTLLGSSYVNDFNIYGRNFRVVAQADTVYRRDASDLALYYVRNSQGNMIPLSSLVTTQIIEAPSLVSHFNLYRNIEILGQARQGYSSGQAIDALKETAAKALPAGYSYDFAGLSREEVRAGSSTSVIFAASIVFVFLFLAHYMKVGVIPLSVLFAVPVGAFGAILTLTLFPKISNNVYAQIGLITLIGLSLRMRSLSLNMQRSELTEAWTSCMRPCKLCRFVCVQS
jgi:HAE1 family hydrophobic/amphiphilic exporter-1